MRNQANYKLQNQVKEISRNKSKKTSIFKSLYMFKPFSFHSREYEIMAPISKSPIMFGWKQVKQYMTTVTGDSVEQITVPIPYDIRYKKKSYLYSQNDRHA